MVKKLQLDWTSLVPLIGEAREALARYDEALLHFPGDLSPLLWAEAVHSLRGQNIRASLAEVLRFASDKSAPEKRAPFLLKIVYYHEALAFALEKPRPLNASLFCQIHALVKQDGPNPKEIGKIRTKQNWIGPEDRGIENAYFLPPSPRQLRSQLASLTRYTRTKEKDPLVQAALFFAEFLILHPFMDGNGRVARILIPLFLWKKGLLSRPALFLSRYFDEHRSAYFKKLYNLTQKEGWEEWVSYFLQGIIDQSIRLKSQVLKMKNPH